MGQTRLFFQQEKLILSHNKTNIQNKVTFGTGEVDVGS